jgi:hypothetical protein
MGRDKSRPYGLKLLCLIDVEYRFSLYAPITESGSGRAEIAPTFF